MGFREVTREDERPLQEIADALAGSHKILLVTGAGISTSCGIPDFRSKDGLYNMIPEQGMLPTPPPSEPCTPTHRRDTNLAIDEDLPSSQTSTSSTSSRRSSSSPSSRLRGQDLFDSRVFQNATSTTTFYQFIASMRQKIRDEVHSTSSVHKFVRVLRDGGRLMRCYTQNIDGLESREGLVTDLARGKGNKRRFMKKHYEAPRPAHTTGTDFDGGCEVVQLHGDLEKLRCTMCSTQFDWTNEDTEIYLEGAAPDCAKCRAKSVERQASGKRGLAVGCLRPNIVLYGEDHPSNTQLTPLIPFDASCQPDVLIIMGTSLKVFGLQKIVREFAKAVHAQKNGKGRVIFVNRTRPAESVWEGIIDDFVAMDCDDWVEDMRKRRSDIWLRQGDIDLTVAKSSQPKRKRKAADEGATNENRPVKKVKVMVEVPPASTVQQTVPKTPSRKILVPKKVRLPSNYPGRSILSPLVQARRPAISPLSSPVRMEEEHHLPSQMRPGTPKRPVFSPITPGLLSGSRLKMEIFVEESQENDVGVSSPADTQTDDDMAEIPEDNGAAPDRDATVEANFMTQIWQRVRDGRLFQSSQQHNVSRRTGEEEEIGAETPSRAPRPRKMGVYGT